MTTAMRTRFPEILSKYEKDLLDDWIQNQMSATTLRLEGRGVAGVEILALDRGPGMANVAACLRDGYSTTGSPGTGLGAISRLSTEFDIYSQPDQGTALLMQLWRWPPAHLVSTPPIEAGVVCVAKHGEPISGDAWAVEATAERAIVLIADGLLRYLFAMSHSFLTLAIHHEQDVIEARQRARPTP